MPTDLIADLQEERNVGFTTFGDASWLIKKLKLNKEVKNYILKSFDELWEDTAQELDPENVFSGNIGYNQIIGSELCENLRHTVEQWFMKKYPKGKEVNELEVDMEMIGFKR